MADARILLAFAALLAMALFYVRVGVRGALAPLCAVATVALGLSLFGALGFLRAGGFLLYLFAAFCAGYLVWQSGIRKESLPKPGFGFWFFAAGGLVFILLLWAKQPLFTGWDEFSLWGTAAKLMKTYDQLYTTAPVGWAWTPTQKPAYIAFGYFFQFWGKGFAEWQTYAACDIFQLGLMAALFAPLEGKLRQNWPTALPLALVALLVPYVFFHYQTVLSVSPAYLDTLADIPLGLCFASALISGFYALSPSAAPKAKLAAFAPAAAALALLSMIKDTGFALALVAAVILAADAFVQNPGQKSRKKRWASLGIFLGLGFLAVLAPFLLWEGYAKVLSGQNRLDSAVTTGGVGMLEMPFAFIKDLLSPQKSQRFLDVTQGMVRFFFTAPGNMLGTGLVVALLCLGLVGLSAFLYKDKTHRLRAACFAALSALGFAAYYLLITMTYLYILRAEQMFESYERYVFPYYIGWLVASLAFLAHGLAHSQSRLVPWARAGVLSFAALLLLRVALFLPPCYTIFGVNTQEYNSRRAFNAKADALKEYLDPDGRTFLVLSDDLGIGWFMYCHQLLPYQVDYSYGGGVLVERDAQPDGTTKKTPVTAGMLAQHLLESGCTTLYIDNADQEFVDAYASLFADGLAGWQEGEISLYRVEPAGNTVVLHPLDTDGNA